MTDKFGDLSVILKLVSGETILCQVLSDTDKNMIIRDPFEMRIYSEPTPEGVRSMTYYADWFLSAKSRIHMIRKEHVMSAAIPDDSTKQEYVQMVDKRNNKDSAAPKLFNWEQEFKVDDQDVERN